MVQFFLNDNIFFDFFENNDYIIIWINLIAFHHWPLHFSAPTVCF